MGCYAQDHQTSQTEQSQTEEGEIDTLRKLQQIAQTTPPATCRGFFNAHLSTRMPHSHPRMLSEKTFAPIRYMPI